VTLFLAALVFLSSLAAPARATTAGNELVQWCEALERDIRINGEQVQIPQNPYALQCWGYMKAVQDFGATLEDDGNSPITGACAPEAMTLTQLIRVFLAYSRAHPNELSDRASFVVLRALRKAFPCS
jgi:hypothetical protein